MNDLLNSTKAILTRADQLSIQVITILVTTCGADSDHVKQLAAAIFSRFCDLGALDEIPISYPSKIRKVDRKTVRIPKRHSEKIQSVFLISGLPLVSQPDLRMRGECGSTDAQFNFRTTNLVKDRQSKFLPGRSFR